MAKKKATKKKVAKKKQMTDSDLTKMVIGLKLASDDKEVQKLVAKAKATNSPSQFLNRLKSARAASEPETSSPRKSKKVQKISCPKCEREWNTKSNQAELIIENGKCGVCAKAEEQSKAPEMLVSPPTSSAGKVFSQPQLPSISGESNYVLVRIPLGELQKVGYGVSPGAVAKRIHERRLKHEQGVALGRVFVGMIKAGEKVAATDRVVASKEDAICRVLELIHDAIQNPIDLPSPLEDDDSRSSTAGDGGSQDSPVDAAASPPTPLDGQDSSGAGPKPEDCDDQIFCPKCDKAYPYTGEAFAYCPEIEGGCGYCQHLAQTGDVCDFCGKLIKS